jgi:hypothetical protein
MVTTLKDLIENKTMVQFDVYNERLWATYHELCEIFYEEGVPHIQGADDAYPIAKKGGDYFRLFTLAQWNRYKGLVK